MRLPQYANQDFSGGINRTTAPHLLPESVSPYAKNFHFKDGKLKKRSGITAFSSSLGSIPNTIYGATLAGEDVIVALCDDGNLWRVAETPTKISDTPTTLLTNAGVLQEQATFSGYVEQADSRANSWDTIKHAASGVAHSGDAIVWAGAKVSATNKFEGYPSYGGLPGGVPAGGSWVPPVLTYTIQRAFFVFDTSPLPNDLVILKASLKLAVESGSGPLYAVDNTQATDNALVNNDYDNTTFTSYGWATVDPGFSYIEMNAAGLANINLSGNTKIAVVGECDYSDTMPVVTGTPQGTPEHDTVVTYEAGAMVSISGASAADPYQRPALIITYQTTTGDVVTGIYPARGESLSGTIDDNILLGTAKTDDVFYYTDGVDIFTKTNDHTTGNFWPDRVMEAWNDRLFWIESFTNADNLSSTVAFSERNDIISSELNFFTVTPNDGQDIIRLVAQGDLYVFKTKSIHLIRGTASSNWVRTQIGGEYGEISARSITKTPYGIFFATEKGVYVLVGTSIRELHNSLGDWVTGLNTVQLNGLFGFYYNDNYWLNIPTVRLLQYDIVASGQKNRPVWWNHEGVDVWCAFQWEQDLYCGLAGSDLIYKLFTGTSDTGTVIPCEWRGPVLTLGNPFTVDKVRALRLTADYATGCTITGTVDFDDGLSTDTAEFDLTRAGTSQTITERIRVKGRAKRVQVKFTESSTSAIAIHSYGLDHEPMKGRRV